MEYRCAREPQKLHYRSFCAWEPRKLRFWSFCARSAPENLVLYKARLSIAAHGNLKNSTTGVSTHGNLRNSVFWVSAHGVRQKTSFSIRHGGASLRTVTSKTPLPEVLRMGTSELRFWSICAPGAPENLVLYKTRWSIAAHGNLKNSTTGVSAHGNLRNSVSGVSAHRVRQETSFSIAAHGNLKNTTWVSAHGNLSQKLRFWSFCARSAPENLVLYKARWSIAAHGNLKSSINGVSAHRAFIMLICNRCRAYNFISYFDWLIDWFFLSGSIHFYVLSYIHLLAYLVY